MALGGETIGRAYIRILADGTGFEADAERQMRRANPTFEKIGDEHSTAYNRGFQSGLPGDDDEPLESFFEALEHGTGRYNRIGGLLAGEFGDGFEDEVRRLFPDVGNRIIENLRESLAKGDIGETGLINRLHNLRREAARAYEGLARDHAQAFNEMEQSVRNYTNGLDRSGRSRRDFLREIREIIDVLPDVVTENDNFRASVTKMRRDIVSTTPRLTKFKEELRGTGETIGRYFGKGSRNDFLNLFGSLIGAVAGASRALSSFLKWPGLVAEQLGRMAASIQGAIDEAGSLRRAFLNLASQGLPGLIAAAVAAVAVIGSVLVAMNLFASAIVGVTGIVLSLAGSLAYGLAGGALAAAGALVPLAVGIGVLALAIGGLDKKNKEVKENLKQLTDEWERLGKIAAKGVFGKDGGGLDNVTALLKTLEPIVASVSKALGGLLDQLGKTAKTKEFKDLMAQLAVILPPMVTTIGQIAGNLGLGLIRAFIVLEPYITNFLGWMEDVSKAFADFGDPKGARGGSELARFMDKASASAMRLWDLITQVGAVIATVFSAGKSTGDNIITKLARAAEDLNKWLTSPEGQQAMKDMFAFAEDLADAFGRIVVEVIEFIDALDTPQSRQMLLDILGIIEWIIDKLAIGAGWLNQWIGFTSQMGQGWRDVFAGVGAAVEGAIEAFGRIKEYVQNILIPDIQDIFAAMTLGDLTTRLVLFFEDAIRAIKMVINEFFTWWSTAWDFLPYPLEVVVRSLVGPWEWLYNFLVGNSLIPELIAEIVRLFTELPAKIVGALGDLAIIFATWTGGVPAIVGAVIPLIVEKFDGLSGKMITAAGSINNAVSTWLTGLGTKSRTAANSVRDAWSGLAKKMTEKAGSITNAVRDWLSGAPGKAQSTASSIVAKFSGLAGDMIDSAGSLSGAMGSWGQAAVREAAAIARGIVSEFNGMNSDIERAIGPVTIDVKVNIPDIPRPHVTAIVDMPATASGGVFGGPQIRMIGEAGPEAVVPLSRPLSQVDPAVRALSAFAQGLDMNTTKEKESNVGTENNVAITVITPTTDPRAVAAEVFNRLVAASYV